MALIKCPECSNKISDKAKKCPHCGYIMERKYCPKCGEALAIDARACSKCAYNFMEDVMAPRPSYKSENYGLAIAALISSLIAPVISLVLSIVVLVINKEQEKSIKSLCFAAITLSAIEIFFQIIGIF